MNAAAISSAAALGAQTSKTSNASANMGPDQFMQLMITQMTHQDPMEPLKDSEFIGQLAQFSTLESIKKLNSSFADMLFMQQLTQGADLIGKNIVYAQAGHGEQRGVVDAVKVEDGKLQLTVGDKSVALADVRGVEKN